MNFVITINKTEAKQLMSYYAMEEKKDTTSHILALYKNEGITITLYKSLKVMFQGKNAEAHYTHWVITFKKTNEQPIKKDKTKPKTNYFEESIGSDESGVGDYFGPLTACAAYIDKSQEAYLRTLDIKDSKSLSDQQIESLAPKLIKVIPYSLMVLSNTKYNALTDEGYNAHKLKAYLHAQAHIKLLEKIDKRPKIIVDQFCEKGLYMRYLKTFKNPVTPDIFLTKAESAYASVAVASIIARYAYLKAMKSLSDALGETLLKGASSAVDMQARRLYIAHGDEFLNTYAKVHFKTTQKIKA